MGHVVEKKHLPLWKRIPLALQIAIAIILAAITGILLNPEAANNTALISNLAIPCNLILKALRALATPLIMLAVLHAFLTADIPADPVVVSRCCC
jgi:Na+/H+-dicarboxylate symporter